MKKGKLRDFKKRQLFNAVETNHRVLKIMQHSTFLHGVKKTNVFFSVLLRLHWVKNVSSIQVNNFCTETGRAKGIVSFFRLSRIKFRHLALNMTLPGVSKSSW
jgi:small subunit ribosomal protein S14